MHLQYYINNLSQNKKDDLLGLDTDDPQHNAFTAKRVVHAGLLGDPVLKEAQQSVWSMAMKQTSDLTKAHTVYIHIPFCQTKCLYCEFYQHASQQEIEDKYINYLVEEIKRDSQKNQLRNTVIDAVFIGGGTPTSLSPQNARLLLQSIKKYFSLSKNCEITFEGRIHDIVEEKIKIWLSGGVNRISLGVQSFNTQIRQQVGRIDTGEEVMKRLQLLKKYDVTVIIDLIYGLPGQTKELWLEDLHSLVNSPVDGMDIYQLNIFPGGALEKSLKKGTVPPSASVAEQSDLYAIARVFLLEQGFNRLSLCHWRRNQRERSLYNTLVKSGAVVYPFGSGAGGNFGGLSFMHLREVQDYQNAVSLGNKPILMMSNQVEQKLQSVADSITAALEKGDLNFQQLCQQDIRLSELVLILELWVERGLMKKESEIYRLTPAGEFWYISITQSLIECVQIVFDETSSSTKGQELNTSDVLDEIITEFLPNSTVEQRKNMVRKIPLPVMMMIKRSSKKTIKNILMDLPNTMLKKMVDKAISCK